MVLPVPQIWQLSESAWLLAFNTGLNLSANNAIHNLAQWFFKNPVNGQQEIIPAYDSMLLQLNIQHPLPNNAISFRRQLEQHLKHGLKCIENGKAIVDTKSINIPVYYDTAPASDLAVLSEQSGISMQEIISIHTSRKYHVYMLGFLPGFCYMGEVDARIAFPRKKEPVKVKAGAVGIAGTQTGVYPLDSPGGWNIIGYTPVKMFDVNRPEPSFVKPGFTVQFIPIDFDEYKRLQTL